MSVRILLGDVRERLKELPDESVHCVVTSPPYFGLRDYGVAGQIGLEPTPDEFVAVMVEVFREVRRVLRKDGVLFLNLGDSYWGGGRGGGGSFAPERRAWHAVPCGISGKEPEGSPGHDCFCQSLCDACREAYQIGRVHSGRSLDPMPLSSNSSSSRVHRVSPSAHLPMSDSVDQGDRTANAKQDQQHSQAHAGAQPLSYPASTLVESSPPLQADSHQLDPVSGCRLCGCSLADCAPASARRAACSCGTEDGASADHKIGMDASGSACRSYTTASLKPKDLVGIPWRVAFALQADGWYLRQDIIWHKPNPMPESVTDRCTKAHEYLFLLSKSARYFYDNDAVREPHTDENVVNGVYINQKAVHRDPDNVAPNQGWTGGDKGFATRHRDYNPAGRNRRSVWTVATQPFSDWTETVRRERVASDAPVDGKKRTASPDCPVHGGRRLSASTVPDGGHAAALSSRSEGNADLFRVPVSDYAPTGLSLAPETAEQSSDSLVQSRSPSAKRRSSQSRKTARAPATTLSCTPCDGTSRHTGGMSATPEISDSAGHMLASSNGQGATVDHPSAETLSRNADTSSNGSGCTCEWYIEKISKTSHFATFPPDLIEPCIKAGCPRGGTVLDPFGGAGTTGLVADRLQRDAILIELNPEYAAMAERRIHGDAPMFAEVGA